MNKVNSIRKIMVLLGIFVFSIFSCEKDFETINENPYNPTETSMEALFNGIVSTLQLTWSGQFYVDNEKLYDVTQLGALSARSWSNTAIGIDDIWNNYYDAIKDLRELERRFDDYPGEQEELVNVKAMEKIILAYKTFFLTDLFGDIPFFDAGRGIQDINLLRPKYDSQEAIYRFLLEELKWAEENIEIDPSVLTPGGKPLYDFGSFDPLFNSDLRMWRKFANALRLRYAIRIADKDRALAESIIGDIINNDLPLIEDGEDVVLRPSAMGFEKESTSWSFREHKNLRMGSTIWKQLSRDNQPDGSGIIDPRAYVFFDVNNDGEWKPYPNVVPAGETPPTEGGIAYAPHRDTNFPIRGADNKFSTFHYYLIRDKDDIPEILISASEVHFHLAEAFKRGLGGTQDDFMAENEYILAISSSIEFWYQEAANSRIWENAPMTNQTEIFQFIFSPEVSFSANDFKLELLYAQEWLCYFRQPWEAFNLWRRTFNTPREGDAPAYYRLTYPADEANFNQENWQNQVQSMGGQDANNVKVWWMN